MLKWNQNDAAVYGMSLATLCVNIYQVVYIMGSYLTKEHIFKIVGHVRHVLRKPMHFKPRVDN